MEKRCVICKRPNDLVNLFEGIFEDEMVMVCEECANEEKIPIIRKPSLKQLEDVDKHVSVRERMEKLSGMHKQRSHISKEQLIVQSHVHKLRQPAPKESHEDVVDNYYWLVNMARRRRKITMNQVSIQTQIPLEILEAIESGKIPDDFEKYFVILEDYFGINLLKHHKQKVRYLVPQVDEEKILDEVRIKMKTKEVHEDEDLKDVDKLRKQEKLKELEQGNLDLSKRKNLDDITLSDLAAIKKQKEEEEKKKKLRQQTEELMGDDLEIEFE